MALQGFMDFAAVQTQTGTLQLPKKTDFSLQKTSDNSFSDMVNAFRKENSLSEQSENFSKTSLSEPKSEQNTDSDQLVKADEEKAPVSNSVKTEKKAENEEKNEKVSVKLDKSEKIEKNQLIQNKVDELEKSDKKPGKKQSLKNLDKKTVEAEKLEVKDFSRIDELLLNANDFAQFVNNGEVSKKNITELSEKELRLELAAAEGGQVEPSLTPQQMNYLVKADDSEQKMDFSFENQRGEVKISKFDKDGKITVEDLRTKNTEPDFETLVKEAKSEKNLKTELKVTGENTATITMDYARSDAQADILSLNNQSAGAQNSNFQQMLNNQIQANIPEFVKAGNIVLKDNNQGTINLVLHPDDLGNVKIQLSLDGKSVQGHIAVATKEALQVFKDNAETLREAFIKNGFDNASFDVSYGSSQSGQFGNGEQFAQNDGSELWAKRTYSTGGVEVFGDAANADDFVNFESNFGKNSVNIVA